jgi:hypothetical protein
MRTSLACGGLGYVLGGAVAAALVVVLYVAVGVSSHPGTRVDPRGGETVFKVAWSVAVFGIGPLLAAAVSLALGRRHLPREALVLAVVVALALYALTAWGLATYLSVTNSCTVGVKWPVTSIGGCD